MSPVPRQPLRSPEEGGDAYRAAARLGFLQAVQKEAPQVGEAFLEIQPHYDALVTHVGREGGHPYWLTLEALRRAGEARHEAVAHPAGALPDQILRRVALQEALLEALEAWAKPHHLHQDSWIMEHVLVHLETARLLGTRLHLGDTGPGVGYMSPGGDLDPPECAPDQETRAQYLARAGAYYDRVAEAHRAAGWTEAPYKPHGRTHLRWLARHHVLGLPYDQCGDASPANIRKAIMQMAELLPLTLRPAPGRR